MENLNPSKEAAELIWQMDAIFENDTKREGVRSCQNCGGAGERYILVCSLPASLCCGGCYKAEKCKICNGSGVVCFEKGDCNE